jgi:hypothetical protein
MKERKIRHCCELEKIVIIEMVYEDHHGPKGTSPKSGLERKERK